MKWDFKLAYCKVLFFFALILFFSNTSLWLKSTNRSGLRRQATESESGLQYLSAVLLTGIISAQTSPKQATLFQFDPQRTDKLLGVLRVSKQTIKFYIVNPNVNSLLNILGMFSSSDILETFPETRTTTSTRLFSMNQRHFHGKRW